MERYLNDEEMKFFLSLDRKDFTRTFIIKNFCKIYDPKTKKHTQKFLLNHRMILEPGTICGNKEKLDTTIGRYIFNVLVIQKDFSNVVGYFDKPITLDSLGELDSILDKALLEDVITVSQRKDYYKNLQWFYEFCLYLTPSLTEKTFTPNKEVSKAKKGLIAKYKKEIDAGDVKVGVAIQDELRKIAKEKIGKDPGFDIFNSGALGSFGNNYTALNIMKGPVEDNRTGKYSVITKAYIDGIDKKDLSIFADQIVTGAYSKGVGTQIAGYMTKKNLASFQSLVLDDKDTDCGSKRYIRIKVTPFNKGLLGTYRYILEKGKLVLITPDNIKNYIGKEILLRSPLYCTTDKICNKCAGELYYMLGIKNIGLTILTESTSLLNKFMKKFHDTTVSVHTMDVDDLVL